MATAFVIPDDVVNGLVHQATRLNLEGEARTKYLEGEFAKYRQILQAQEREERQARRDAEERQRDAEERDKQREHELAMARLAQASPVSSAASGNGHDTESHLSRSRGVMKPYQDEGDMPLDVYLLTFDRCCSTFGIDASRKVRELYFLLPTRLLQILNELPNADLKKYDTVRDTLLRAENFSPEDCRERYVTAFPRPEENTANFLKRKERLFDDWLRLAEVPSDKIKEFLIIDGVMPYLPLEMASHVRVKLKGTVDLQKAGDEADEYLRHSRPGKRLADVMRSPKTDDHDKNNKKPLLPDGKRNKKPHQPNHNRNNHKHSNRHQDHKREANGFPQKNANGPVKAGQPYHPQKYHSPQGTSSQAHHTAAPRPQNGFQQRNGNKPLYRSAHAISKEEAEPIPKTEEPHYDATAALSSLSAKSQVTAPSCQGTLNGVTTNIVLDTGAEGIFVDRKLVDTKDLTGSYVSIRFAEGKPVRRPCCNVMLKCRYYTGKAPAIALENPAMPVFMGRMTNLAPNFDCDAYDQAIREWKQQEDTTEERPVQEKAESQKSRAITSPSEESAATCGPVSTRSTARDDAPIPADVPMSPLKNREEFKEEQQRCSTLQAWWTKARRKDASVGRGGRLTNYEVRDDGLLHQSSTVNGQTTHKLCIPASLRRQVMYMAHHTPLSGHRGKGKTYARIEQLFVWPKMRDEIDRYVASCPECQVTSLAATPKAPMGITKLSAEPFAHVCVDIVGPLEPASSTGKRFILTFVDMATRYPDAVALSSMDAETVSRALFDICSRVGFPECLTSDNGTNFTSHLFEGFLELMRCKHIRTSVYHSQSNGACERYNGTLKRCLRKLTQDFPRQWDRYLPAALFAYRDTPHETTGYSPFELIYGHKVRGPLEFLQECWQSPRVEQEDKDVHEYILRFSKNLKSACRTALKSLQSQQQKSKLLFDRRARRRILRPGDKVLLLLPTDLKKLMLRWKGPYTVTKRFDADHYAVLVGDHERKYHINVLKLYNDNPEAHRDPALALPDGPSPVGDAPKPDGPDQPATSAPIMLHYSSPLIPLEPCEEPEDQAEEAPESEEAQELEEQRSCWLEEEALLYLNTALAVEEAQQPVVDGKDPAIPTDRLESYVDCQLSPSLSNQQHDEIMKTLASYDDTFNDLPGLTTVLEHDIKLVDKTPFRHSYALPHHLSRELKKNLETWLRLGIIEPSDSPYCSPMLAVKKQAVEDHRFCLDLRALNAITVFDGEPIADPAHIFTQLSQAEFLTKLDLASGFWQVPLSKEARPYTAFVTRYGTYQFKVLPFGMKNAPGCFSRLMRKVLRGIEHVSCFIDDILIHAPDWKTHMSTLKAVLHRLRDCGLHAKPSKCELGYRSLRYLGHIVGQGRMTPVEDKVIAIQAMEKPSNVTQLRSFLGSTGYYQKFIPGFNSVAAPLHDMLKGKTGKKTPVEWTSAGEVAFTRLKEALIGKPVLQLIDPELPFILQTDASDDGLGAVLLQVRTGDARELAPVMYASRKLKPAERNYSVIEKEALAVYWAFKKFEVYLYGRHFVLRTDHRPLLHLQSADKLNPRLKRWSLYMSLFTFTAQHIEGENNHMADLLSRRPLTFEEKHEGQGIHAP